MCVVFRSETLDIDRTVDAERQDRERHSMSPPAVSHHYVDKTNRAETSNTLHIMSDHSTAKDIFTLRVFLRDEQ